MAGEVLLKQQDFKMSTHMSLEYVLIVEDRQNLSLTIHVWSNTPGMSTSRKWEPPKRIMDGAMTETHCAWKWAERKGVVEGGLM